jgi:glucuronoarabinoxylan endo-1,4-beta-xylanase
MARVASRPRVSFVVLGGLLLAGCGGGGGDEQSPTPTPTATPPSLTASVTVTAGQRYQRISGFGASSAWHSTAPSDTDADNLFSADSGAGLSLLRIRIAPDGTTSEMSTVRKARDRAARIWAAPWSPPGAWKTNGSDINGGKLKPEYYQSWADRLADFALSMSSAGFPLDYLSAQNEPGWVASWETCEWTSSELLTFIRDYLGPAIATRGLSTPILAPETNDWIRFPSYADPLLADPVATGYLGVIAMHHYGGSPYAYTTAAAKGKELWETEMSVGTVGTGINSGLDVARSMHDHLTVANVNAWHYWWITDTDPSLAGALIQGGTVTKRLWVMGNYSRFVRPGSYRIGAAVQDGTAAASLLVTAFRNEATGRLIVVAANTGGQAVQAQFTLTDLRVGTVTPWVTSQSLDLAAQATAVGGSGFRYFLPAQSVTTFVGQIE